MTSSGKHDELSSIFPLRRAISALLIWIEAGMWAGVVGTGAELAIVLVLGRHDWSGGGVFAVLMSLLAVFIPAGVVLASLAMFATLLFGVPGSPVRLALRLHEWMGASEPRVSARRSALILSVAFTLSLAVAAGAAFLLVLGSPFNRPIYNAVASSFFLVGLTTVCVLCGRTMWLGLAWVLERLLRTRARWLVILRTPWRILAWPLGLGVVGFSVGAWDRVVRYGMDSAEAFVLPLLSAIALAPLLTALAVDLFRRRTQHGHEKLMLLGRLAALALLSITVVAGAAVSSSTRSGRLLLERSGALSVLLARVEQRLTDWDGDGHSGLYGGGDCAPFDRDIHPSATEILDNRIDENCSGEDLLGAEVAPPMESAFVPSSSLCDPHGCDFLLVIIDTLRADRVGSYGSTRGLTPNIDAISARGVRFDSAYSVGPNTGASLPPLFSMRYKSQVKADQDNPKQQLKTTKAFFTQQLSELGYATAAVVGYPGLEKMRSGFDRFDNLYPPASITLQNHPDRAVSSPEITDRAISQYLQLVQQERPFFLWVHYYDPHALYIDHSTSPDRDLSSIELYEGEVRFTDASIGRLLESIRAVPGKRPLVIVMTSDHGEGLGDHGIPMHGDNFYRSLCQVPLIVAVPGVQARVIRSPVSLIDLGPTFLNLAGGQPDNRQEGRSLVDAIAFGKENSARIVFHQYGGIAGLTTSKWRLFRNPRGNLVELYGAADKLETDNLIERRSEVASELMRQLDGFIYRVW